jgi:crossover junction endodeoxyribonuclease RuvC
MAMIILGIDPGVSGAIAFLATDKPDRISVYDMPILADDINPHPLRQLIRDYRPDWAIIERSHPHPREGVKSVWRYAAAFTTAVVVVKLLEIPLLFVTPAQWKKALHLTKDKEQSRARAIETFPPCSEHFQLKKHHNRAEAAMLAFYASTLQNVRNNP